MHHAVLATRSLWLKLKSHQRGEVVTLHRDEFSAREKARKLNTQSNARWKEDDFVAVHCPDGLKKGDIREDLIVEWEKKQVRDKGFRLMQAILAEELTGKRDMHAEDAGVILYDLGLTLEQLREMYEVEVREKHAVQVQQMQEMAQRKARGFEAQQSVNSLRNQVTFSVPAVRGVQAGKEFYLTQVPYGVLAKMFVFDDEQVPAELRAQRTLNPKRAQGISEYMLSNRDDYVLPSLTASVDKAMCFEPIEGNDRLGTLYIPMDATMLINDGQHRRYAIELCLKADAGFQHETAPVQIHFDQGLKRSQQIFSDINSRQVKPSSSINALYDHRNPFNAWVLDLLAAMPDVKRRIDFENANPGARSYKLWSLVSFKRFVTLLTGVGDKTIGLIDKDRLGEVSGFVVRFMEECSNHIPQWNPMLQAQIPAFDVREQFVIGHAVFLEALGVFARVALFHGTYLTAAERDAKLITPDRAKWMRLAMLQGISPAKDHPDWQGRCVHLGKMQKTTDGVKSTAALLLKLASIELPAELAQVDARVLAARDGS